MVGKDALSELQRSMIPGKRLAGEAALQQMEDHLSLTNWFVGDAASLPDIALFAYTHVAGEGGFDLGLYPHFGPWIARVRALPKFVPIRVLPYPPSGGCCPGISRKPFHTPPPP